MRILGLDLSLSSTGYNVIDEDNNIIDYGKLCTTSKNTEYERIYLIAKEVKAIIQKYAVDIVIAEDQFFSANARTGLTLSKLMGATIYVCMGLEVEFETISPTQARKMLLGLGKSTKEDVANFIRENHIDIGEFSDKQNKSKGIEKTSDIYDSLCVSLAWNKKYQLNKKYK
jgi:crossover junction endodeoxyribonuclease RuvC